MKKEIQRRSVLYGVYFVSILLIVFLLFFYSVHAALPSNVLTLPLGDKLYMESWFPQGWGFYSKNPREEAISIFDYENEEMSTSWPHNSKQNLYGLKRFGRAQGLEAGLVKSKVPDDYWIKCDEEPFTCAAGHNESDIITVNNETPFPTICGEQLIVLQEPVPWAWSKYKETVVMPSQIARVNVLCSGS